MASVEYLYKSAGMLRLLAIFAAVCAWLGGAWPAAADILIATVGPMKGQYAAFGEQLRLGAQTAVDDINAAGGLNGEKLALVSEDDNCEPRQAATAAAGLVAQNVRLVVGHYCSAASIAAAPTYAAAGILMLSPASTSPRFTDEGGWNTNRVVPRDDAQGGFAGAAIAKAFSGKSVAILNDGSAFGAALARRFKLTLNSAGLFEKLNLTYKPGRNDYDEQVNAMLAANVDVVYIGGYPVEAGTMIRHLRELASNAVLVGGDPLLVEQFWSVAGTAGEGTYATFMQDPLKIEQAQALVARLSSAGTPPEGFALHAYAAVQAYVAAAKATGSMDNRKISEWLRTGNPLETVIGKIALDGRGDLKDPVYAWYKWSAGKFTEVPSIAGEGISP